MRSFKFRLLTGAALAVSAFFVAQSAAAFDFNGYFRAGAAVNSDGGRQVCVTAPGTKSRFRLGNECLSVYADLGLDDVIYDKGGVTAGVSTILTFIKRKNNNNADSGAASAYLREAQVWIENPFGFGAHWWAGKRYYRYGVYTTDFFYWNQSGVGFGVQSVPLGSVNLGFAVMLNDSTTLRTSADTSHNEDLVGSVETVFQLKGIDTNPGGELQFAATYIFPTEDGAYDNGSKKRVDTNNGFTLLAQHTQSLPNGGSNRLVLQYGKAAGARLNNDGIPGILLEASDDAQTYRILDNLRMNVSKNLSLGLVAMYQHSENADELSTAKNITQVGGRLVYHLTDNLLINFEAATTWTEGFQNDKIDDTARLSRFTIAPAITTDATGFFSWPQLRVFASYITYNDTAAKLGVVRGGINQSPFQNQNGWVFGVQTEVVF